MLRSVDVDAAASPSYPAPDRSRIVVVADGAPSAQLSRAIEVADATIDRVRRIGDIDGLDATRQTIVVELHADGGAAMDALLDRLDAAAAPAVVLVDEAVIDVASARLGSGAVSLLCRPAPGELAGTIALALAHRPGVVAREEGDDERAARIRQLTAEMERLARTLADLARGTSSRQTLARDTAVPDAAAPGLPDAAAIRALIRARRLRGQFLDPALFADPAWDMLLDLTAARLEGTQVAVSSLCIAAAVPPTTALRWIGTLTAAGLIERVPDATDGRRVFIALTDHAASAMAGYFAAVAGSAVI